MTPQQQLIEKYGAEESICEIPAEEFENDGLVVQILREKGITTDALIHINAHFCWATPIEQFINQIKL
jgi:hypothetical protein